MSRNARGVSWTRKSQALALLLPAFAALALVVTSTVDSQPQSTLDAALNAPTSVDDAAPVAGHDHATHDHGALGSLADAEAGPGKFAGTAGADGVKDLGAYTACGPGNAGVLVPSRGVMCIHAPHFHGIDLGTSTAAAEPMAPRCYGDGVSGNRVRLYYAYAAGHPDRSESVIPAILGTYVPLMESAVRRASDDKLGIRFWGPSCQVTVTKVELPPNTAASENEKNPSQQFGRIANGMAAKGYASNRQKHLVWFDGASTGPCGIAAVAPDDTPSPLNLHNGVAPIPQTSIASPNLAIAYAAAIELPAGIDGQSSTCWGAGTSGARTETHELLHNLGAVAPSSPNSNGLGHCTDGPDIMCYQEAGRPVLRQCHTAVEELDCNRDDYFNVSPAIGSYLSTHWNIARSSFLGSAPLDVVPSPVPLP